LFGSTQLKNALVLKPGYEITKIALVKALKETDLRPGEPGKAGKTTLSGAHCRLPTLMLYCYSDALNDESHFPIFTEKRCVAGPWVPSSADSNPTRCVYAAVYPECSHYSLRHGSSRAINPEREREREPSERVPVLPRRRYATAAVVNAVFIMQVDSEDGGRKPEAAEWRGRA
jgi:hypothetical protein